MIIQLMFPNPIFDLYKGACIKDVFFYILIGLSMDTLGYICKFAFQLIDIEKKYLL